MKRLPKKLDEINLLFENILTFTKFAVFPSKKLVHQTVVLTKFGIPVTNLKLPVLKTMVFAIRTCFRLDWDLWRTRLLVLTLPARILARAILVVLLLLAMENANVSRDTQEVQIHIHGEHVYPKKIVSARKPVQRYKSIRCIYWTVQNLSGSTWRKSSFEYR